METKKRSPIDTYLAALEHPAARRTLATLRAQLKRLLPGATETLSYGMPAFRTDTGKVAAGFGFFGRQCGLYPHSGNIVPHLGPVLDGYRASKAGVTFPPDQPLPLKLVTAVVKARLAEIAGAGPRKRASAPKGDASAGRVTDAAVKEATKRDWRGWMKALDAAGAQALPHPELVAHLRRSGVKSSWWQQTIAVAYERARGKRVVGETAKSGFQLGVQKTMRVRADGAWALVAEHPERWLGEGVVLELAPGHAWQRPGRRGAPAVQGVVRVVEPGKRLRMTWHAEGWERAATLQLTLMPKATGTSLHVHMEKLPDAKAREAMREHWRRVLEALAAKAAT